MSPNRLWWRSLQFCADEGFVERGRFRWWRDTGEVEVEVDGAVVQGEAAAVVLQPQVGVVDARGGEREGLGLWQ